MGRIKDQKNKKTFMVVIIGICIIFAIGCVFIFLNPVSFEKIPDEQAESTNEVIAVNVSPGQGYEDVKKNDNSLSANYYIDSNLIPDKIDNYNVIGYLEVLYSFKAEDHQYLVMNADTLEYYKIIDEAFLPNGEHLYFLFEDKNMNKYILRPSDVDFTDYVLIYEGHPYYRALSYKVEESEE